VPLIEAGEIHAAYKVVQSVIDSITDYVDTIVLGCTHYTVLKDLIRKHNEDLHVLSQDEIIPPKLKDYLYRHPEIDDRLTRGGNISIELSSQDDRYLDIQKEILKNLV